MIQITVFFENPFWAGIFERIEKGEIATCRVVFGPEPKDYEVYRFIQKNYWVLKFSGPVAIEERPQTKINPKRLQREIKKTLQKTGVGTKAQEAIKKEHESRKQKKKSFLRKRRDEDKKIRYKKKQEKKKIRKKRTLR